MSKRLIIDADLRCPGAWPAIALTALPDDKRTAYLQREDAVNRYLAGDTLTAIENTTGVARQQLYNLLRRCLAKHPDGRIYGFRGLTHYGRIKQYDRYEPVSPGRSNKNGGAAGAMTQLLDLFPSLRALIKNEIRLNHVSLTDTDRIHGLRSLHKAFLQECTAVGVSSHQYPFNQLQHGKRSLAKAVKMAMNVSFQTAARASGAELIHPMWHDFGGNQAHAPGTLRPFEVAEFDGHKLDIRLRVRLQDPFGLPYDLELKRVWLLVVLDVCTRVVLGWHVVLASEYDHYDVIKTMQNALQPRRKRIKFSIPKLAYEPQGGFASQELPKTEYACWDWLRLDNAKANLAEDTIKALRNFLGCFSDAGPVHQPNERPYIERFFGTIGSTLSHRLPGTTGTGPADIRRRLSDPGGNTELLVTFEELEELLDVTIANYNGTDHSGSPGRSPLEAMRHFLETQRTSLRPLPEHRRRNLFMMQPAYECTVRGNKKRGLRPHINFFGARYSSMILGQGVNLIGTKILIYFDPQDLRFVQAFLPSGAELGPLQANAPWHRTAHSLRLRREILRLKRVKDLTYGDADDPVAAYLESKRLKSVKTQRRSGHRIAEATQSLQTPSVEPVGSSQAPAPAAPTPPAKPRQLTIGNQAQSK